MQPATTLTRRSLLRSGVLAAAATLAGGAWRTAPAAAAAGHLRRSAYDGLVGQRFAAGGVELRLLSVTDLAGAAGDKSLAGSEDAFALTFSRALDAALEAGTHTVRHPRLGRFELFVAPVGQPGADRAYEAVIDRSVGAPKSPPRRRRTRDRAPEARAAAPTVAIAAPHGARLLRRVALRRKGRGVRATIVLRPAVDAVQVHACLIRRGKTIAVAARDVRDRRAVLRFRGVRDLRPGRYTLLVTIVDDAGLIASRRRRVTLR
jgi:hypothetical protein